MTIDLGKKLILAEKLGEIRGWCSEIGKDAKMEYMGESENKRGKIDYMFYCYGCEKVHVINSTKDIPRLRFKSRKLRFTDENNKDQEEYLI